MARALFCFVASIVLPTTTAVEVAVSHKFPYCATAVVMTFLLGVVVGIIVCSNSIDSRRRLLRGGDFASFGMYE
jgi:hypothetical protein